MRIIIILAFLLFFTLPVQAQAVCEGTTGNGRCNSANEINFIVPTTNTDGTVFNDYASTEIVYSAATPVCSGGVPTVAATIKNVGPISVPIIPLANTTAKVTLGPVGFLNGKVFATVRVVDTTGNRSGCGTPELNFTYDNLNPSVPTLQIVK